MGDEERKVVGEIVASGLSVAGWCAATGRMGTTKAYRILNWFREKDPSAFGAGEEAAREPGGGAWFERVRAAVAEAATEAEAETRDGDEADKVAGDGGRALAAAATTGSRAPVAMGASAAASAQRRTDAGSLALVDATALLAALPARASPAITVEAMGVTVTLPAGSAAADVSAAVSATLAALGVAV